MSPMKGLSNIKTSSNSKRRRDHSKSHSSTKKGSPDQQKYKTEDLPTDHRGRPDATNLNNKKSEMGNKKG